MRRNSLLDKATGLYNLVYKEDYTDECQFDYIAFSIQQIIELSLKYMLERKGIKYPCTHELIILRDLIDDDFINSLLPDELAIRYYLWETKSRYNTNFLVTSKELKRTLEKAKIILDYTRKITTDETSEF